MITSSPHHPDCPALDLYLQAVREATMAEIAVSERVARIAEANRAFNASGAALPDRFRAVTAGVPYSRNLVWNDAEAGFSVIAIVWGAFQETRVHDHLNWCVVNMIAGECMTMDYERRDDESNPKFADLRIRESRLVTTGDVCALLPPPRTNIHKMASASRELAVSLHTYGDPGTRARIFDPASGQVEIVELSFHNVD